MTEEKHMQENLRFFLKEITKAQEEERKRIAQELHDDLVHALVIHGRQIDILSTMTKKLPKRELPLRLEELRQETNQIMQGVQRLSQDLRPSTLDRLGLLSGVEWLASRTGEYSGINIDVNIIGDERRLPDEIELVLFRITQEALSNVWKHAEATQAEVVLEFHANMTRITIKDNGKGFPTPTSVTDLPRYGKLGLAGIKERAELAVLSKATDVSSKGHAASTARREEGIQKLLGGRKRVARCNRERQGIVARLPRQGPVEEAVAIEPAVSGRWILPAAAHVGHGEAGDS